MWDSNAAVCLNLNLSKSSAAKQSCKIVQLSKYFLVTSSALWLLASPIPPVHQGMTLLQ